MSHFRVALEAWIATNSAWIRHHGQRVDESFVRNDLKVSIESFSQPT